MTVHIYIIYIYKAGGGKYIHKAGKWADAGSEDEEQPGVRKKMREHLFFALGLAPVSALGSPQLAIVLVHCWSCLLGVRLLMCSSYDTESQNSP